MCSGAFEYQHGQPPSSVHNTYRLWSPAVAPRGLVHGSQPGDAAACQYGARARGRKQANSAARHRALVRSGQVRALAVTPATRSEFAPELPTIAESGVPGYNYSAWYGLYVPAKTAGDIVRKLHDDTVAALSHPQVRQRFAEIATVATPSTSAELAALLKADMELWGSVIKAANIKGE